MTKRSHRSSSPMIVDLISEHNTRKLVNSLRELVVILFAVVFGVGLSKIAKAQSLVDYFLLATVYIVILQSWWGYNLGVIAGPPEKNKLCYGIDILLLVLYWFMIDKAFDLFWVLWLFPIMFALYVLWEAIRWGDTSIPRHSRQKPRRAFWINLRFLAIFLLLLTVNYLVEQRVPDILFPFVVIGITSWYRVMVGRIYSQNLESEQRFHKLADKSILELVTKAREASHSARIHLSNFPVGAAVLTIEGKVFTGCNVEFDNYSNTLHAEEVAIGSMVAGGETKPHAIAVYTVGAEIAYPCGMCLQSLFEIGGDELIVIACNDSRWEQKTIADLLPCAFKL